MDHDWARRISELRQYASDLYGNQQATLADYDWRKGAYIQDLIALAATSDESVGITGITDPDEMAILVAEWERIVN